MRRPCGLFMGRLPRPTRSCIPSHNRASSHPTTFDPEPRKGLCWAAPSDRGITRVEEPTHSVTGRWRAYDDHDLIARDKANLDIFWLRDDSLEDSDNLPDPGVIAQEIVEDLEAALEQFREIATDQRFFWSELCSLKGGILWSR